VGADEPDGETSGDELLPRGADRSLRQSRLHRQLRIGWMAR
jgi:hypothetical protein